MTRGTNHSEKANGQVSLHIQRIGGHAEDVFADLQHTLFWYLLDGKLYLAPLSNEIGRALDIGTGTGIWAIDFADQHPSCQVIGTDLSSIQPGWVPSNVEFLIDDAEESWVFGQPFDYIHLRVLIISIRDWARLIQQGFANLNPGGYMEISDWVRPMVPNDDTFGPQHPLWEWNANHVEAARRKGQPFVTGDQIATWMRKAGFEDVVLTQYLVPTNPWARDPKMKALGKWMMMNMLEGIEAFTLRLWTSQLGWSVERIQVFLTEVRKDIMNTSIHSLSPL